MIIKYLLKKKKLFTIRIFILTAITKTTHIISGQIIRVVAF